MDGRTDSEQTEGGTGWTDRQTDGVRVGEGRGREERGELEKDYDLSKKFNSCMYINCN